MTGFTRSAAQRRNPEHRVALERRVAPERSVAERCVVARNRAEFCLFLDGADLTDAALLARLRRVGFARTITGTANGAITGAATGATAGASTGDHGDVRAMVFRRQGSCLTDAVRSVVTAVESTGEVFVAREARSGAVAVFDPVSARPRAACAISPNDRVTVSP